MCSARLKGAIFQKSSIEGIVVSSEKYSRLPSFDVTILPEHVHQHTQSFCRWERHSFQGVTKTKTLENEDLRPKTRLSFRDYEN